MRRKYNTIEDFRQGFYEKFPLSNIEIIKFITNNRVEILNDYGKCIVNIHKLLESSNATIRSAINKREYFINQAKEVHLDYYDYSKVLYKNSSEKVIIICPKHGEFNIAPNSHLCGVKCAKCAKEELSKLKSSNTKDFVDKANKKHNYKYDYSLVEYKSAKDKVIISCHKHGNFLQTPSEHLSGHGCKKCGIDSIIKKATISEEEYVKRLDKVHNGKYSIKSNTFINTDTKIPHFCNIQNKWYVLHPGHVLEGHECRDCGSAKISKRLRENPLGWNYSTWEKAGNNSTDFDGFKLYIIKCWNDDEEFYKVGKTFMKIKKRFDHKKLMPYNYEIIKIIEGDSLYISKLEQSIKNENSSYKYTPKIKFCGESECFIKIN